MKYPSGRVEGIYMGMRGPLGRAQVFKQVGVLLTAGLEPGENPADVFEWGQSGPRCRRLAMSLLTDYLGDAQEAVPYCLDFAEEVLAKLSESGFCIFGTQVESFIQEKQKKMLGDVS